MGVPCNWLVHSVEVHEEESKHRKKKCWSGWNHFCSAKQHEILILCGTAYIQNMLMCSVTETQRPVKNRGYRNTLVRRLQAASPELRCTGLPTSNPYLAQIFTVILGNGTLQTRF